MESVCNVSSIHMGMNSTTTHAEHQTSSKCNQVSSASRLVGDLSDHIISTKLANDPSGHAIIPSKISARDLAWTWKGHSHHKLCLLLRLCLCLSTVGGGGGHWNAILNGILLHFLFKQG